MNNVEGEQTNTNTIKVSNDLTQLLMNEENSQLNNTTNKNNYNYFGSNYSFWIILILLLSLVGINIFMYLSNILTTTTNIFSPIFKFLGLTSLELTKTAIDTTSSIGSTLTTGSTNIINKLQDNIKNNGTINTQTSIQTTNPNFPIQKQKIINQQINTQKNNCINESEQSLEKALNDASRSVGFIPDDSFSSFQSSGTGKYGWCFIGNDRGTRICAEVGVNDSCMSQEIFPNQQICINPNLRT